MTINSDFTDSWHSKLVGELWDNHLGISAMGVLIRLARLNYLHASEIRDTLGIVVRRGTDLFGLMTHADHRLSALAATRSFHPDFAKDWRPESWWPFSNAVPQESLGWTLRICPRCMVYAYHTLLFQMPGIHRCPWHGCELRTVCTRCKKPLLNGYNLGAELMQCLCGHDHVNEEAALIGDIASTHWREAAISRYRHWCNARKDECWLIAPAIFDAHGWSGVSALADHPYSAMSPLVKLDHVSCGPDAKLILSPSSGLEKHQSTMASLPSTWERCIQAICRQLAGMMPPGALTVAERRALDPKTPQDEDRTCDAIRPWLMSLSGYTVGRSYLLHTSPIDGIAIRALSNLAAGLDGSPPYPGEPLTRRAFRKWVRMDPRGLPLIESTIRRVLTRSYADGSRALLGQSHPDLFAQRNTRPVRRFPWVEIRLGREATSRIAWTRQLNI